ncbi:MAG: cryptochrome/photolyase family protein, partial [Thalassobaculaceae bacterium]
MAETGALGKPSGAETGRLILVLGDQLTPTLSALAAGDPARDRVLMVEAREEGTYVPHHRKKIAFILSAMRHFRDALTGAGWSVDYITLDDPQNTGSLVGEVQRARLRHGLTEVLATEPGEWRLKTQLEEAQVRLFEDDRFLCDHARFDAWAAGRKQLRMEYFYRDMRRDTGL